MRISAYFLFFFLLLVSVPYLRFHCQIQHHEDLPMFFSKSFIDLALTVRLCSIVYKLLYMVWEKGPNSFFCMCVSSCLSHFCWKDDCFPAEWFWQAPWKAIDDRCADLYLGSEFYSIDLLSALVPISYFLGYSNFVVTVQVGTRESSNIVIFFP